MKKSEEEIKRVFRKYKDAKGEKKSEIMNKLLSMLEESSLDNLQKILPDIKSSVDSEFSVEITKIYEGKMLEDIEKFKTKNQKESIFTNQYLFKLFELFNKVILCTSQKIIKKKYIKMNLDRAETLFNDVVIINDLKKLDKEHSIRKELVQIKKNLQEINATKEEILYIISIIDSCNDSFRYQNALLLFEKKQYFDCLKELKSINKENYKELNVEELENKCNLMIGKKFEEEGNLEKAKDYYSLVKYNEAEVIRIKMIILKNKIDEADKNKDFDKVINLFLDMSNLRNDKNFPNSAEEYYSSVFEKFYKNLILLVIKAIEENEEKSNRLIQLKLEEIIEKVKNGDNIIKINITDLINIFNEIIKCKGKNEIYNLIKKKYEKELSDMAQRVYIQILINSLMDINEKDNYIKIIDFIIEYLNKNYFFSQDNIYKLRNIFKEFNKQFLIKTSEMYKLIIVKGLDYSLEILQIIGNIIIKLIISKSKKNLEYSNEDYNLIIKNLFQSFEWLIKEQTFDLSNIVKIYEKIIQLEKNNKELIYVFFSGLIFINKKKYEITINVLEIMLNYAIKNEGNDKLLELIIDQLIIGKNPKRFDLIPKLLDTTLNFYPSKEDNLFSTLIELEIPYEFYEKSEFIESVENYLKYKVYYNENLYKFLRLIPLSARTDFIEEKLELFTNLEVNPRDDDEINLMKLIQINSSKKEEEKNLTKLISNHRNKILQEIEQEANSGIKINYCLLNQIEKNLEIKGMFDILYKVLTFQKDMISLLYIDKISKYFSSSNYKLFDLIIENNCKLFNNSNLENIAAKLGEDDENQNKLVYLFFDKLSKSGNIPIYINDILNTYKEIKKNKDVQYSCEETTISELIDKYYKLPLVPKYTQKTFSIILNQFFGISKGNMTKIIIKLFKLILKNGIDIGEKNFSFCINKINENELIKQFGILLSSAKIPKEYKTIIYQKFLISLIQSNEEEQFQMINEIKYFIDNEELPINLLSSLINILENVDENDLKKSSIKGLIYRELLFIMGILFSLNEKPLVSRLIKTFCQLEEYKLIQRETSKAKLKTEEIFYIYSNYIYMNRNDDINVNCEYFLNLPRNFLIKEINSSLKETKLINTFSQNLKYYEEFNGFGSFSPVRDHFLRQLIYQKEIKPNSFGNILVSKCLESKKYWKYKGELKDGKKWGIGTIYYNNGDILYGNFVNDMINGEGILINKEHPRGIRKVWKDGIVEEK